MQILHATFAAGEGKRAVDILEKLGVEVEDYKLIESKTGDLLIINLLYDKVDILIDRLKSEFNFSTSVQNSLMIFTPDTVIPRNKAKLERERTRATRETIITYARESSRISRQFVFMALMAAIVTSLGLIINNTPVIVGSMIIAPVFGPIAAVAVGIVLGDLKLLGRGLIAELLVIGVAILVGIIFGGLLPNVEINRALQVRMFPTLPDLLIALSAGGAGAYSLITNVKSRQLVGVVIAAALIPVMATIGIGVSLQNIELIRGATLLLGGNLFSLLLAIILVFYFKGLKPQWWYTSTAKRLIKRSLLIIGISVILLTFPLGAITYQEMVKEEPKTLIRELYRSEFDDQFEARLFSIDIAEEERQVTVVFYTPEDTSRARFQTLEAEIKAELGGDYEVLFEVIPTKLLDSEQDL